jgi:hypothetical protein
MVSRVTGQPRNSLVCVGLVRVGCGCALLPSFSPVEMIVPARLGPGVGSHGMTWMDATQVEDGNCAADRSEAHFLVIESSQTMRRVACRSQQVAARLSTSQLCELSRQVQRHSWYCSTGGIQWTELWQFWMHLSLVGAQSLRTNSSRAVLLTPGAFAHVASALHCPMTRLQASSSTKALSSHIGKKSASSSYNS